MKKNPPSVLPLFFLFILFVFIFPANGVKAESDQVSLADLAKSDAAKFYVSKQYQQSLEEFQKLEAKYPQNTVIKRYIASLYDILAQPDKAIDKLKEILTLDSKDLTARQMLGDLYAKKVEFALAKEQFNAMAEQDPQGVGGTYAKKRIQEIDRLSAASTDASGRRMSAEDFLKSQPSRDFANAKYKEAIQGFDALMVQYPDDVLVRRFRGLAFLRLQKWDDAQKSFNEALKIDPNNAASHLYLGQVLAYKGKMEDARKEYQWIIANDNSVYKVRAQAAIFQTLNPQRMPAGPSRPWSVYFVNGYDFDTNATYKSRDPAAAIAGDQNSSRFNTTLTGTYRFIQKRQWTFTADGLYTQSLYVDFPNLQTYTSGLGVSALYAFNFFKKPSYLNIREGATHTFLKNKFYVFTNSISPSLIINMNPRWRTTLTGRWNYSEYDNDGSAPDSTSRDGFGDTFTFANTFYLNQKRSFYTTLTYEYERNDTEGVSYIKNSHSGKFDFHMPLLAKVEADLTFKLKDSMYPKYALTPPKRRDGLFNFGVTLTRPLTKYLTLSAGYTYEDVSAVNNSYEYDKNVFTTQITYRY